MESEVVKCRGVCGLEKVRVQTGRYDAVNKRWQDESGGYWNGRVCPDCHRAKVKLNMQNKRKNVHSN